jgi:cytoskeleton protein RodZ
MSTQQTPPDAESSDIGSGDAGLEKASFTPGELLRSQREMLELSVQHVADTLNLTMHFIRSLESDSYDKLPGDVFVRGYIRSYARLVRLDPDQLIEIYDAFGDKKQARKQEAIKRYTRRRRDKNRPWVIVSGLAFVLVALALWFFNRDPESAEPLPSGSPGVMGSETPAAPADQTISEIAVFDNSPAADVDNSLLVNWPGDDRLEIIFAQQSWVEVAHEGGDESYQQTQLSGDHLRVFGSAPFLVSLDNASAATVIYNGRSLDISNNIRSDNSARLNVGM